jgi:catechol 2,3-dioxygenase-like lactoylglutathione lyase family enzyme
MLSGLNHLTLAVSQLAPSVAFYQQLLGMTLHARWDSGAISPAAICGCACRWIRSGALLRRKRATTPIMRLALAKPISPASPPALRLPAWRSGS